MTDTSSDIDMEAAALLRRAERAARQAMLPAIRAEGEAALRRLLPVAQSDTGQSRRVARFLLALYNGPRFPFDLSDLRGLDYAIHADCIALLLADHVPEGEIHCYIDGGREVFEGLAASWGFESK